MSANSERSTLLLEVKGVDKAFEGNRVLRDIDFNVHRGEILALLGPSGCGKTTMLRLVAGLEQPDRGKILLEGGDLQQIPVHRRRFGMVFQDFALFPHKNVLENVKFGLRMAGRSEVDIKRRVTETLNLVGMAGFEERSVYELSGGEQQRVALARSLAPRPRLILLDEPLGSLDRALRERLMTELRSILKQAGGIAGQGPKPGEVSVDQGDEIDYQGVTSIYVTHDQEEAFAIADRVAVMKAGRIEQIGSPLELYRRPVTAFVARFLGMENILSCDLVDRSPLWINTPIGKLYVGSEWTGDILPGQLLIRPEAATIKPGARQEVNLLHGRVESVSFRGRLQVANLLLPAEDGHQKLSLTFDSSISLPAPGAEITLSLDPSQLLLLE